MDDINKYYKILDLKPGDCIEEVKQAWRDMVIMWHPDRLPSDNHRLKDKAQEKLKEINNVAEVFRPPVDGRLKPSATKVIGTYDRFEQRSQSRCIGDTTVQVIFSLSPKERAVDEKECITMGMTVFVVIAQVEKILPQKCG
ncbi:MAG: J domain-containing protein [Candidatus Desantisbacteria bacterium]